MSDTLNKYERHSKGFTSLGIPTENPGFYDHPNYLAIEKDDPSFLFQHGRFVHWRQYDTAYLERAESAVRIVAEEVHRGLKVQDLHGACIVTCMILQRILDRHGVWSAIVKGAFRASTADGKTVLGIWPVEAEPDQGRENGHQWIYAPPYRVVDLTLNLQGRKPAITNLLPQTVLSMDAAATRNIRDEELINSDMLAWMAKTQHTNKEAISRTLPHYKRAISPDFGAYLVKHNDITLKYITVGFGGSDGDIEELNCTLAGKFAYDFYASEIRPKVDALGR